MSSHSFDVVSRTDLMEVKNAISQAMMEIRQRFDFKGSKSDITLEEKEQQIVVISDDEQKLKSVDDILQNKLVKRKVSLKALDFGKAEPAASDTVRQVIKLQQGIPVEKAREMVKFIKGLGLKVQGQIMDNQVRVSGKSKDDLQTVMQSLRGKDFGVAMSFDNYR